MSGEKHTTTQIDPQQSDRIQQNTRVTPSPEINDRINQAQRQTRQEFNQRIAPIEQRTQQHGQAIDTLKTGIKQLERDTNDRIQQNQQQLRTEISQSEQRQNQNLNQHKTDVDSKLKDQRSEYQGLIQQQSQRIDSVEANLESTRNELRGEIADVRSDLTSGLADVSDRLDAQRSEYYNLAAQQDAKFSKRLAKERAERQRQLAEIQLEIAKRQSTEEGQKQFAIDLFKDAQTMYRSVNQNTEHQRFAPNQLTKLYRKLEAALEQAKQQMWQAVCGTSQEAYFELADLRSQVVHQELQWALRVTAASETIATLLETAKAYRDCTLEFETEEGKEPQKIKADVNHWADGKLEQFEQAVEKIKGQLADEENLTPAQLDDLEKSIASLPAQLTEIVEQAKLAIVSSQLRVEMATQIAAGLEPMGYRLVDENDATYEGEDDRASFVLKMVNSAGDEVVTVISPQGEFGINSLSINTFSQTLIDESSYQQNADAIVESLNESGIQAGEVKGQAQPRQEYRDIDAVRNRSPQQTQLPQAG